MKAIFIRIFGALSMSFMVFALASCGGGGGDPGTPILANPPKVSLISLAGTAIPPNQTVVLQAHATDDSGHPLAGATVTFSLASSLAGGKLSSQTATTSSSGDAQVLYTAGPTQGQDTINVTVTGAQSKTATASVALQIGIPQNGPQVAINLQPGQTSVAPNSTTQITAIVTSGGQPVANQLIQFTFGLASSGSATTGPALNGSTTTVSATTDTSGRATVTYVAGPQAGIDTIIATYSQNNVAVGIGSVTISVSPSASPAWRINLTGLPSSGTCTPASNNSGAGLQCAGLIPNGISNNGVQQSGQGVAMRATVLDQSGRPVPNAVIVFSLGSVATSTGLPYCTPPAILSGNVCHTPTTASAPAVPDTAPTVGNVQAGFASQQATVVPSITAVTDANGVASARYIAGGAAGTDIVLVTAGYNTGSVTTPAIGAPQGTQSASMQVQ